MFVDVMLTVLESRSSADLTTQYKTSENLQCPAEDRGLEDHISHCRWRHLPCYKSVFVSDFLEYLPLCLLVLDACPALEVTW